MTDTTSGMIDRLRSRKGLSIQENEDIADVLAAVVAALDGFSADRPWTSARAHLCLSAVAKAVGR